MATMPADYFDRYDPEKNYEQHLFIAGRGLQSAELNEIQRHSAHSLRAVADALFKDGDIVRDASVIVDSLTGEVQCQSGAVYIRGNVRGVAPASFTIPIVGIIAIGIRLQESVVTSLEDPDLLDPAPGTRNYSLTGAERLKVLAVWGWDGDGQPGEFFPVYSVVDGQLTAKEPPPNLSSFAQTLARYDRDSAGGTYVVTGMKVSKLPDVSGTQIYSIAEGRARVYGFGVEFATARRVAFPAVPDLKSIINEPHVSTTAGAQRVNFDRTPGSIITAVSITTQRTVTLTHGVVTGSQDPLPDTSILSLIEVKQGVTVYTEGVDYQLTAGKVDWSLGGAEPAPGSTYSVTYRYIAQATPTAVDDNGFTVTGAVVGTLILVSYSQKLPRIDRLCINTEGIPIWILGVAAEFYPQSPGVPDDLLPLASVYQTWTASRRLVNDGVRVVPMPQLAAVDNRLDYLLQLIAAQRLESSIHTREGGTKKGLFVDPFIDDSQRDAGTPQTAAVVNGLLMLPISGDATNVDDDITKPTPLNFTNVTALEQPLRTGDMKINPYMAFDLAPAQVTLAPAVDRWTEVVTTWASPLTRRFASAQTSPTGSGTSSNSQAVLLQTTTTEAETLRPITVEYSLTGFAPGEAVASVVFDGVTVVSGGPTADSSGVVSGSFTIPADIPTGAKLVVFNGGFGGRGEATFTGQGTIERQQWQQQTTITTWRSPPFTPRVMPTRIDPLAQTFTLTENAQISAVDLWFSVKPTTRTSVQLRSTAVGFPTQQIIAEAFLMPAEINIGGATTRAEFEFPVNLLSGEEYALVVLCNDPIGALSVAELGKFDSNAERWITSQPYTVGVLLSSSNASTWTVHQDRDMAFRILRANFTENSREIDLGNVAVTGATDLLLMAYAERPSSQTGVNYKLTLPDASVITVDDGQPVQLGAPITGDVGVAAILTGNSAASPILFPGTQLVAGTIASTGDYVSRAVPGGASVTVKVIFEALVPSGATLDVYYKGPDLGDTWASITLDSTRPVDDGFVEFIYIATGVNELSVQTKIVLNGSTAARPYVRDLRVIVL